MCKPKTLKMTHVKWLILLFSLVSLPSSKAEKNIVKRPQSDITTKNNDGEEELDSTITNYIADESRNENQDLDLELDLNIGPKLTTTPISMTLYRLI